MRYYPISLDIAKKECLVVGGGSVGTRKSKRLLQCGAIVNVISKDFTAELLNLEKTENLVLQNKPYNESDLEGQHLVISSTDDKDLNKKIASDADSRNILCNIADLPDASNFVLPSVVHRGDLTISISTSGKSPAFSRKLRKDLEKEFGDEYSRFLTLLGTARKRLLASGHDPEAHKIVFRQLVESDLLELIRLNKIESINLLLEEILGKGFSYKALIEE